MPGELVTVMEGEVHHPHGLELDAGPQELAAQLAIPDHPPLSALTVRCHDSRVVHNLGMENVRAMSSFCKRWP